MQVMQDTGECREQDMRLASPPVHTACLMKTVFWVKNKASKTHNHNARWHDRGALVCTADPSGQLQDAKCCCFLAPRKQGGFSRADTASGLHIHAGMAGTSFLCSLILTLCSFPHSHSHSSSLTPHLLQEGLDLRLAGGPKGGLVHRQQHVPAVR
jgi:hypothetical protein